MKRRSFLWGAGAALPALAAMAETPSPNQDTKPLGSITLPKPNIQGGKPLLEALSERKTLRNIGPDALPPQMLSNLLWAAFGVNRPDGKRTAPSAMNVQDIDIYVFLPEGVYVYDAAGHILKPVLAGDQRAKSARQPLPPVPGAAPRPSASGPASVPVTLVYIADQDKAKAAGRRVPDPSALTAWSNVHVGFIVQNVYLFAASEGLASSFRANVDPDALTALLNLRPAQKPLYSHLVGYPSRP